MASTNPIALIASASCFNCYLPVGDLLKLGLLKEIALALNPMADTSPQALIDSASCYRCFSQPELLELALLALIAQNTGGGGGGSDVRFGNGVPVGNNPGTPTTQYTDEDTGVSYIQNPDGSWSLI